MINITLSSVISLLTQYGIQEKTHSERFQKLRLVTNINILEIGSPNTDWLTGGELILSTLNMCSAPANVIEILKSLSCNNASALGVHCALGKQELITPAVVEIADSLEIAVLIIPDTIAYSQILSALYDKLLHTRSEYLDKIEKIQNEIKATLMEEDSVHSLIEKLNEILGSPVALLNEYLLTDAFASKNPEEESLRRSLQTASSKAYLRDIKKQIRLSDQNISKSVLTVNGKGYSQLLYRVSAQGVTPYYFIVWRDKASSDDDNFVVSILEYAAQILAIHYIRNLRISSDLNVYSSMESFYYDILCGKEDEELLATAYKKNIHIHGRHSLCKIKLSFKKNSLCDFKDVLIKVKRLSNWLSIHSNADSYVIAPDREILFILHYSDLSETACNRTLSETCSMIQEELLFLPDIDYVDIYQGEFVQGLFSLPLSLQSADKIQGILSKLNRHNGIYGKGVLGIYYFLDIRDIDTFDQLCRDELFQLSEKLGKHSGELMDTLECYYENNCNLGRTARQMYLHPNTIKYRLHQIREKIGAAPLDDGNEILKYHLLLKRRWLL
ncbi:MAG: helix-turn-helix domain-containing protein [Emergencia timonensis]|uniref:PucR family transcriptional regulator n=1 Tax=Emergencia timonensis TaxID=1776384 RepID=A0A415DUD6_9FIRM|nr:helix-turn-helix domain-containing protein [Emergencia timonensis]MBS6178277.1 helix-turn-helix domain-containing protein [Clostridiales bacterium]MCB6477706.1 PucR family transcriptional regulator [Emergencia timonensis]RHJ83709.1 PucR family transcriptional regulator [Emergencia timonensis]WNX89294.1 helix-turn-helix domain-containing protein [Emergencia timonensis]BDF07041.1 purine catabolism regulatory protein [Emergencia timonensis]